MTQFQDKLEAAKARIESKCPDVNVRAYNVDIQSHAEVNAVVKLIVSALGDIEVLINNVSLLSMFEIKDVTIDLSKAGLALGAPGRFWELPIEMVEQMNGTNITGVMYMTHSVLNHSMWPRKRGTIINVSSVTGLECPPFEGEAVYHANKACLEAFTNSLRMETAGSNIRVSVLRPGCVVSHFHLQRVKYDQNAMDEFFYGYEPLVPEDLAEAVWYMVSCPERITIKALDCVPTAQRALTRFDREWNARKDGENKA